MNRDEARIEEEAAAWQVASVNDDMDWDGFTRWLEADPRHRRAFDEAALADTLVDDTANRSRRRLALLRKSWVATTSSNCARAAAGRCGWARELPPRSRR